MQYLKFLTFFVLLFSGICANEKDNSLSLKNLSFFTLLPMYSFTPNEASLKKKTYDLIQKDLAKIGKTQELKITNTLGMISKCFLIITIDELIMLNEKQLPILRISLNVQTPVFIKNSDIVSPVYIWSRNIFTEGKLEEKNQENILKAIDILMAEFTKSYQIANENQPIKPTFYLYTETT